MGDKIINHYAFPDQEPDWERLRQMFKRNVSKFGCPFFVADSEAEQEFLRFCAASDLAVTRKTII